MEKLARRVKDLGLNKAKAARKAGLLESTIGSYISKPVSLPPSDIALKISRAIQVPLDWLIDDEQEYPPPPLTAAGAMTTVQLVEELGRRMHEIGVVLLPKIKQAEDAKWYKIGLELAKSDPAKPLPRSVRELVHLPFQLNSLMEAVRAFDPVMKLPPDAPAELLKAADGSARYSLLELQDRYEAVGN